MSVTDEELKRMEQEINQTKAEEPVKVETPEPPQPTQEQKPPVEPVETPPEQKPEFDPKAYVEKKGWKTPEDAAQSFRELEKKFHENNQKKAEPQAPAYQPPMQPYGYQPQAYQPPVNPYGGQPRITEDQVAASYGMTVEDFRKVAMLARDMSEANTRQLQMEMQKRWEETNRQAERSSDMANALSNPAFQSPEVRAEMHEILSKNPELMNERKTYSIALKEALANLGLRSITGGSRQVFVPTTPPEMGGSKGAGGSLPGKRNQGLPSLKELEVKSADEIEKTLKQLGLNRTHMDY